MAPQGTPDQQQKWYDQALRQLAPEYR